MPGTVWATAMHAPRMAIIPAFIVLTPRPQDTCFCSGPVCLLQGGSRASEIGEFHFRVFTREQHAVRTAMNGRENCLLGSLGGRFTVVGRSGNIDIESGPKFGGTVRKSGSRALRLAQYVIRRKSGLRNLRQTLLLIIHHAIVKVEQLLLGHVAVDRIVYMIDITRHSLAGTVVINHDLEEIGVLRNLRQILLGA